MTTPALFEAEEVYKLIPQRPPMVMLSAFYQADDTDADTGLLVKSDNIFCEKGVLTEPGLIEHIAQSAAAFAGYPYFKAGKNPPLGYIGEIKKCSILQLPPVGSLLKTHIHVLSELLGITLIQADTTLNDQVVVSTRMKIFIKSE